MRSSGPSFLLLLVFIRLIWAKEAFISGSLSICPIVNRVSVRNEEVKLARSYAKEDYCRYENKIDDPWECL